MKKIILLILVVAMVVFIVVGKKNKQEVNVENIVSRNISLEEALSIAINDEYKALATYEAVIAKFGEVKPFSNIIKAEENHISSLENLFTKYGFNIPENIWSGNVVVLDSISEMCEIGVRAEIENAELYKNKLMPAVSDYDDVVTVFEKLMKASENNHLNAFKKCE